MKLSAVPDDIELCLHIDDDHRHMQYFGTDEDYPDSDDDEMNTVRVSIETDTETIGYMELYLLYEDRIDNIVMFADGIAGDVYRAMSTLEENGLLEPFDPDNDSVLDMLDSFSGVIVHLNYIAVRDDFRNKGIGGWLFRNLPKILSRNYGVKPRIISTTICPQSISWGKSEPSFLQPDENSPADEAMRILMEKLFVKNGYQRLNETEHFYVKPSSL